jgi:hypothetical protein
MGSISLWSLLRGLGRKKVKTKALPIEDFTSTESM